MKPDQSQGACQAIEDAAALGIIFSSAYSFTEDVRAGLRMYERIRKPRATRVQVANPRTRTNIPELSEEMNMQVSQRCTPSQSISFTLKELADLITRYDMHKDVEVAMATSSESIMELVRRIEANL
jgi:salicylate hydroxylase